VTARRRGRERAAYTEELRGLCRELLRFIHSRVPDPRARDLEGYLRAIGSCSSLIRQLEWINESTPGQYTVEKGEHGLRAMEPAQQGHQADV